MIGRRAVLGLALSTGAAVAAAPVLAQDLSGPVVSLDRYEVAAGDRVTVFVDGFTSNYVTISFCGAAARNGSSDCNMTESQGLGLRGDTSTVITLPVAAPPAACPCVVRVSSPNNDEIAVAPITIVGHPVEELADEPTSTSSRLDVAISATEANDGVVAVVRSGLGGRTTYEVEVSVRNPTTELVTGLAVVASAGKGDDEELVSLQFDPPSELPAGQTWTQTVTADVPAPSFGEIEWRAVVSGAGPALVASDTTSATPVLLYVALVVLALDLAVLIARRVVVRRRRRLASRPTPVGPAPGTADPVSVAADDVWSRAA